MPNCFACGKDVLVIGRVGRNDVCEHCDQDLHCCRNCEYFDLKASKECREPLVERVKEKDRANFCDFFKVGNRESDGSEARKIAEAKLKLEALFKKKT